MDSNSSTGATKRFDGAREDAARRYWKWRKWAHAYLTLLEAKGTPKEAHGSALFCLLDGPAELALVGLNIEELCVVNGADRLFSCLDERFPDLENTTRLENTGQRLPFECRQGVESFLRRRHEKELSCLTLLAAT